MTIIKKHIDNYEKYRQYYQSPFLMLGNQDSNLSMSPKEFFGVDVYKTIDPDGGDYDDLTGDLKDLHQRFATVFNLGTLEHIWDVHTAWSNTLKLIKIGGFFVGVSPIHGYFRHGIHLTDPIAILTFLRKNGFEVKDHYYSHKKGMPINTVEEAMMHKKSTCDVLFWYAAEKIKHVESFIPPTQIWEEGKNTVDTK
jgi:hypothetical protein